MFFLPFSSTSTNYFTAMLCVCSGDYYYYHRHHCRNNKCRGNSNRHQFFLFFSQFSVWYAWLRKKSCSFIITKPSSSLECFLLPFFLFPSPSSLGARIGTGCNTFSFFRHTQCTWENGWVLKLKNDDTGEKGTESRENKEEPIQWVCSPQSRKSV